MVGLVTLLVRAALCLRYFIIFSCISISRDKALYGRVQQMTEAAVISIQNRNLLCQDSVHL